MNHKNYRLCSMAHKKYLELEKRGYILIYGVTIQESYLFF